MEREEDIGDHSFLGKFNIQFSMGKDESLDTSTKGQTIGVSLRNFNEFFIIRRIKVKLPKTRVLEYNYEVIMRSVTLFWLINCHPMTYSAVESLSPAPLMV